MSKLNFPVAKFKLLVAKSKFGLIEENLPPILYRCHWYIVLVIGSIPFLKVSTLINQIMRRRKILSSSEGLTEKKKVESQSQVVILAGRLRKKIAFHILDVLATKPTGVKD